MEFATISLAKQGGTTRTVKKVTTGLTPPIETAPRGRTSLVNGTLISDFRLDAAPTAETLKSATAETCYDCLCTLQLVG